MADYVIWGQIMQAGSGGLHTVIVCAVPDDGQASALGVIVRKDTAHSAELARVARDRLLVEVRAEVAKLGDTVVRVVEE